MTLFFIGLFVGATITFFVLTLVFAAKIDDDAEE